MASDAVRGALAASLLGLVSACHQPSPGELSQLADGEGGDVTIDLFAAQPPPQPCVPGAAARIGTQPFATVQEALDASSAGDTLVVCVGVHLGALTLDHEGPLTLLGETLDPADVVLDAEQLGPVLRAPEGVRLRARGITFTGGQSPETAGIHVIDGYAVAIEMADVVFEHNVATGGSGIVSLDTPRATLLRAIFRDNEGYTGTAGVMIDPINNIARTNDVLIKDSLFERNVAYAGGGGALYLGTPPFGWQGGRVTIERTRFVDNTNVGPGGAIQAYPQSSQDVIIDDCEFIGNVVDHQPLAALGYTDEDEGGGAIYWNLNNDSSARLLIRDTIFERNESGWGSALHINSTYPWPPAASTSRVALIDTAFYGNMDDSSFTSSALFYDWGQRLTMRNVVFGTGPDLNEDEDIFECGHVGTISNADWDPGLTREACP